MMLKEKSSPWAKLKYLYVLPLAAIAVTAFARPEISETAEEISAVKVNDLTAIVEAKNVKSTEDAASAAVALPDTAKPAEVKYIPAEVKKELKGTPVFEVSEQMPEFPGGGMPALLKYLQDNMRYPESAKANGTQGRVSVQFIVDKEGHVQNPMVVREVDKDLDAEAIRLVKSMPKWNPGMQDGKAVDVKFTVPVMFRLEGGEMKRSQLVTENKPSFVDREDVLWIIDGKEVTPSIVKAISVEEIASISVLKDKASVEIYGEKGKNGVVLMTLKNNSSPSVIGFDDKGDADVQKVSDMIPGVGRIQISSSSALPEDVTVYLDGEKMDMEGKELNDLIHNDQIESIRVEKNKDGDNKSVIRITSKKGKSAKNASARGDMKVEGRVVDKDGEPVIGASVLVEGSTYGTITDVDGNFVLSVSKGDKLLVAYIGMVTAKVEAAAKLTVTLKDE